MPTGYPGKIILAHFPPVFFREMRMQMKKYGINLPTNEQNPAKLRNGTGVQVSDTTTLNSISSAR
jgi:hypothetical protein